MFPSFPLDGSALKSNFQGKIYDSCDDPLPCLPVFLQINKSLLEQTEG